MSSPTKKVARTLKRLKQTLRLIGDLGYQCDEENAFAMGGAVIHLTDLARKDVRRALKRIRKAEEEVVQQ